MKKAMLVGFMLLVSCAAYAGRATYWTYSGEKGPDNWAKLSPDHADCDGKTIEEDFRSRELY